MTSEACVHIIDDEEPVRRALSYFVAAAGFASRVYESAELFLESAQRSAPGCVVTDVRMPGIGGLELVHRLKAAGINQPVIVMSGQADILLAVDAMKAGAVDFLPKPFRATALVAAVRGALAREGPKQEMAEEVAAFCAARATLSPRQRDVLAAVVAGKLNKTAAHELGISVRTLEGYRAEVLAKTHARSSGELIKLSILASL